MNSLAGNEACQGGRAREVMPGRTANEATARSSEAPARRDVTMGRCVDATCFVMLKYVRTYYERCGNVVWERCVSAMQAAIDDAGA